MKITYLFIFLFVFAACSSVMTRKEAAEAKAAANEDVPPTMIPIRDDESAPTVATPAEEAPPAPIEDQVLDDELAALGIDPNSISQERATTPEPEGNAAATPAKKKKAKKATTP